VKLSKTRVDVWDGRFVRSRLLETILWRDVLWLVGGRSPTKNGKTQQPTRLIRPRLSHWAKVKDRPQSGEDYTLNVLLPKAILDGQAASGTAVEFDIVEAPEIQLPIPITPNQ
jgi:hypothetical protein